MFLRLICLLLVLCLSACAPASAAITPSNATNLPHTGKTLTVLAAASLTDSFKELGQLFESRNPGVKIAFSFAGSQQLAQQIDQGAPADVFASASQKYMDVVISSGRVRDGDPAVFASNRLVVIFPKDNPAGLVTLQDLAKPGIKLDLADQSVPVGQYALNFLDQASGQADFGADFKENVLKNVVSYETDVKVVVSKVSLGEADAGLVYITDFKVAADQLGKLDIPDALNSVARYPIAPIADSQHADLAKAFVALVLSPEGQSILAKYGFLPVLPASP